MFRLSLSLASLLALAPLPSAAAELPPGLVEAELLPAHATDDGTWMTALRLQLEPGWKTYWRSPGDSGVPPQFDWKDATNFGDAVMHWPSPEVIESAGERSLGYHEMLVLPIEMTPSTAGAPVAGSVEVELGLCFNICVPARLSLPLPPPADAPDPEIQSALAREPRVVEAALTCVMTDIADGVALAASVDGTVDDDTAAALELAAPDVWVSSPELSARDGRVIATSDFVPPSGKPFPLDPAAVRLTLIGPDGAVEYQGCDPA